MSNRHVTTVQVTRKTWGRLKEHKELGQSMDDVISKLLDKAGATH